jgi:hypothetical protein
VQVRDRVLAETAGGAPEEDGGPKSETNMQWMVQQQQQIQASGASTGPHVSTLLVGPQLHFIELYDWEPIGNLLQ